MGGGFRYGTVTTENMWSEGTGGGQQDTCSVLTQEKINYWWDVHCIWNDPNGGILPAMLWAVLKGLGHSHNSPATLFILFSCPSFTPFPLCLNPYHLLHPKGLLGLGWSPLVHFISAHFWLYSIMLFIQPCILLIIRESQEEETTLNLIFPQVTDGELSIW